MCVFPKHKQPPLLEPLPASHLNGIIAHHVHVGVGNGLRLPLHCQHLITQHNALSAVRPLHIAGVALTRH